MEIEYSAGYAPNENCSAERQNQTILNCVRSLLIDAGLAYSFWAEAQQIVVDIRNPVPKQQNIISPFEELRRVKPSVKH